MTTPSLVSCHKNKLSMNFRLPGTDPSGYFQGFISPSSVIQIATIALCPRHFVESMLVNKMIDLPLVPLTRFEIVIH